MWSPAWARCATASHTRTPPSTRRPNPGPGAPNSAPAAPTSRPRYRRPCDQETSGCPAKQREPGVRPPGCAGQNSPRSSDERPKSPPALARFRRPPLSQRRQTQSGHAQAATQTGDPETLGPQSVRSPLRRRQAKPGAGRSGFSRSIGQDLPLPDRPSPAARPRWYEARCTHLQAASAYPGEPWNDQGHHSTPLPHP